MPLALPPVEATKKVVDVIQTIGAVEVVKVGVNEIGKAALAMVAGGVKEQATATATQVATDVASEIATKASATLLNRFAEISGGINLATAAVVAQTIVKIKNDKFPRIALNTLEALGYHGWERGHEVATQLGNNKLIQVLADNQLQLYEQIGRVISTAGPLQILGILNELAKVNPTLKVVKVIVVGGTVGAVGFVTIKVASQAVSGFMLRFFAQKTAANLAGEHIAFLVSNSPNFAQNSFIWQKRLNDVMNSPAELNQLVTELSNLRKGL